MKITAYQTLEDRDNIEDVENEGPFKCTRNDAWLGHGYYFWDTNIQWAKDWGENSYMRRGKNYIICRCGLDLSVSCFDLLGSVSDQMAFTECVQLLKDRVKNKERLTVPNIIEYLKKSGVLQHYAIRAGDFPYNTIKVHFREREFTYINPRVQVCVIIKKGVFLPPFQVIYPENYL